MMDKRIYYINSRNRVSGTSSDFHYVLDMKGIEPTHAVVLSCYIPKSYYTFQDGYNSFTLEEDGKQATITIPAGTYNRSNLRTVLTGLLNTGSPNNYTYSIAVPLSTQGDTGHYTFTVSDNGGIQPAFIFTSMCFEQLGFEENSTNNFETDQLESVNIINLQPESTIYIKSDLVQDHDNILQEIYGGNSISYSGIAYTQQNVEHYSKPLLHKDSNSFRFYITNEDNQPLDLNGLNCVFSVMVWRPVNTRSAIQSVLNMLSV